MSIGTSSIVYPIAGLSILAKKMAEPLLRLTPTQQQIQLLTLHF